MLGLNPTTANLTTAGNGLLTAALLLGGSINRSGATGDYTDTTDTAANIAAALQGMGAGASWRCTYVNTVAHIATIAAGTGVTLGGASAAIPASSAAELLITVGPGGAVTMTVLYRVAYD